MNIYALISHNDTKDATDFVRDPKTGKVVFVEQDHAPAKDARELFWVECVRTDDTRFARGFNEKLHVRGEPMFTLEGGRAYATFPLVRK